jgi:hypothetical protein
MYGYVVVVKCRGEICNDVVPKLCSEGLRKCSRHDHCATSPENKRLLSEYLAPRSFFSETIIP